MVFSPPYGIGSLMRRHFCEVEIGSQVSKSTASTGSAGVDQCKRLLVRVGSVVKTSSRFKRVAVIVFTIQAAILIGISTWLFAHFDLSWDYAVYFQPWYLLAHGHLSDFTSVGHTYNWMGHFEWLIYPLGLMYFLYPHGLTLLIVQDLAIVGAEVAGLGLMCDLIQRRRNYASNDLRWLQWVGLFFLVANPWSYWAVMFDFHFHSLEAFAITMATWQFYRTNTRLAFAFVGLCMVTSIVSITFLFPLAILLFFFFGQRRNGIIVGVSALSAFLGEQLIFYHGLPLLDYIIPSTAVTSVTSFHKSSNVDAVVTSFLRLPSIFFRAVRLLWSVNIYANLGPDGLLGVLSPFGLLIPGVVLIESALVGPAFTPPSSQNVIAYSLLAVGTVSVLARIAIKIGTYQ